MEKKQVLAYSVFFVFLASLPAALALTFDNVWRDFISMGNLSFLGFGDYNILAGLTRLLLAIMIFTLFFALLSKEWGSFKIFERNHAVIIALVLAIMSSVFMPVQIILAVGTGWGTAVAFILIGAPIVGIAYLLHLLSHGRPDNRFTVFVKIILCLIMLFILNSMKYYAERLVA